MGGYSSTDGKYAQVEMTFNDVIDLYTSLENLGIKVWVDGGWSVDALLGKQTRVHEDLDIAVEAKHVPTLREFLKIKGYEQSKEDSEWNFVLRDRTGREIDVHSFNLDEEGNVLEGIPYPIGSLTGTGTIDGNTVRCIAPQWLVKFHSGYALKEKDFKDVSAICEKFGIELPEEYAHFKKSP